MFKNGYAFKSKDFVDDGFQLIRIGNLYKSNLTLERNPVYLPKEIDPKLIEKYSVTNGEILLSLTGTKYKRDYGYAVKIQQTNGDLLLNQRILSLKPLELAEYTFCYLQSNIFRDIFFSYETGGVNQGNVGSKAVESTLIPWPPIEDGEEIGEIIEDLLDKEKETLGLIRLEDSVDILKQSILSKAFKGELGTNDPADEHAIELLKEVLQENLE